MDQKSQLRGLFTELDGWKPAQCASPRSCLHRKGACGSATGLSGKCEPCRNKLTSFILRQMKT